MPYFDKYNWKGLEFPAWLEGWKNFKQNNKTIALNVLFVPFNTETIRVAHRSEYNTKREKQVNLLMITNKWHYLAISKLAALLAKTSSTHDGDIYGLKFIHYKE